MISKGRAHTTYKVEGCTPLEHLGLRGEVFIMLCG